MDSTTSTLTSPTFTKKLRTLRKRPNQNYNEATILLAAAYPSLFSTRNLKNSEKFIKPIQECYKDSSEPLLVFREYDAIDSDAFSFESKRRFQTEPNRLSFGARERNKKKKNANCEEVDLDLEREELDCESMLEEEIEEGIDSIMGRSRVEDADCGANEERFSHGEFSWVRALRRVHDDSKWWNFLVVDMLQVSPPMENATTENLVPTKRKKKEKKVLKKLSEEGLSKGSLLKLNCDDVQKAWSDRGSPFASGFPGNDVAPRFKI
ncbi:hypothetical protein PHAVU_009G236100 [Phaseolus vulgaris]|uniref:Uncharacterized protein n=1 Tax=Phaseolus vulgaris TaxID=3885 RepID=V7AYP8_PHAVU|nr:hypothetical protein PHAVU_009G236100g [Phaseolus vulgaris]ESW10767.1 hypothetical protein PHAVU_009G236100g [Phaseolus vulgaris]